MAHDIVVFQHPFYWCSAPALLKEWQDLVLEYGFAYGAGRLAYQRDGINYFTIHELLAPFHQIARRS